eukprot:XP_001708755.1 Hypothetical protein GL50803_114988 [Giardia lamblia ATCC 50803]
MSLNKQKVSGQILRKSIVKLPLTQIVKVYIFSNRRADCAIDLGKLAPTLGEAH